MKWNSCKEENAETGEIIEREKPSKYNLKIRRVRNKNDIIIEAVPPEEILINRNARSLEESSYVTYLEFYPRQILSL